MISRTFMYVLLQNRVANFVFMIAVVAVLLLDVVYVDTKELFDGGAELASLMTNIAMSLIAGYIFYVVSAVKLDVDRINRSKKASSIVVNRILGITSHLFSQLSESTNTRHSSTPDEYEVKHLLEGKMFSDVHRGKVYSDFRSNTSYRTLHYFLFEDSVPNNLKVKKELELYFSLLEPELQIAFCDYFNCKFYSNFADVSTKLFFKDRAHKIDSFIDCFVELSTTAKALKSAHEKIYGQLGQ
ncbi:hypothetical protein [Vibrio parahaemolyticus]|uniref:hypothetical protein n=1 Tax=Vibrio parahaemolyticus TaxID=670 RepID=UPI001E603D2E|nr:hypothetical protein [Vibrio parahaemolyticus]